jgi:hypothetical protein
MSDKMRWRYGDTNPVIADVDSETVIEIGDLLWQDTDNAKPASDSTDQESFADKFLGVAMQRSREGCTDPIRVATTGVFEFESDNESFELGDYVMAAHADQEHLTNQSVLKTDECNCAIGRVAKRVAVPGFIVLVDIRSTVMTGGVLEKKR